MVAGPKERTGYSGQEGLSLLWRTLLQNNQVWRRIWSSLPQQHPRCRQLCRVGLSDAHTSPSCSTWTQAKPGHRQSPAATLGGWVLAGLTDQHQQRQDLQSCSAPESHSAAQPCPCTGSKSRGHGTPQVLGCFSDGQQKAKKV